MEDNLKTTKRNRGPNENYAVAACHNVVLVVAALTAVFVLISCLIRLASNSKFKKKSTCVSCGPVAHAECSAYCYQFEHNMN